MDDTINFFNYCLTNNLDYQKEISNNISKEHLDSYYRFAFHYACMDGYLPMVVLLLPYVDKKNHTYYFYKSWESNNTSMAEFLLSKIILDMNELHNLIINYNLDNFLIHKLFVFLSTKTYHSY
jgi:hypothetical protein